VNRRHSARDRLSVAAARNRAGFVERRKGAGISATIGNPITKLPAFHRRLNATQPAVSISLQPFVHTRNGQAAQAKRRGTATIGGL